MQWLKTFSKSRKINIYNSATKSLKWWKIKLSRQGVPGSVRQCYLVLGFQRNLPQIFIASMALQKNFQGQRSKINVTIRQNALLTFQHCSVKNHSFLLGTVHNFLTYLLNQLVLRFNISCKTASFYKWSYYALKLLKLAIHKQWNWDETRTLKISRIVSANPTTYMAAATALANENTMPIAPPNSGPRLRDIR